MNKERNFIVFYRCGSVSGWIAIRTKDPYLNYKNVAGEIKADNNIICSVVITNIIELSAQEVEWWVQGMEKCDKS
jgi:hypothetical protein